MLTVDDCNTILEKYSNCSFWYTIDLDKVREIGGTLYYDNILVTSSVDNLRYFFEFTLDSPLFNGLYYFTKNGEVTNDRLMNMSPSNVYTFDTAQPPDSLHLFLTPTETVSRYFQPRPHLILPITPLQIPIVNGEFDEKFYIKVYGDDVEACTIDNVEVEIETDENGTFIRLPSANDCTLGIKPHSLGFNINLYPLTFIEYKQLPNLSVPQLYRGTPQQIKLINNDTQEELTKFQAYYQSRLLKDNIINLPFNAEEYIDITVDLHDPDYVESTLKLKAPTSLYIASNQEEVETAISNGIQTLQVGDNETEVTLNSIELSNVTLINSNIQVSESILTDCQIIDSAYTDNGANIITDTTYNNVTITSTETNTTYNDCILDDCTVTDTELHITGTLTNNTFNNTLIISDGIIATDNNIFNGVGSKTYFPSHLYLTGEFILNNNTFNLTGEWEELQYNMCLIKATSNFNPSEFINKNTFNLNITYDDEPTNTFYYNIVDDDKIRAVRL